MYLRDVIAYRTCHPSTSLRATCTIRCLAFTASCVGGRKIGDRYILPLNEPFSIKPVLNCSIRCGHVLLTTEKIRAPVDNIRGKKDRAKAKS